MSIMLTKTTKNNKQQTYNLMIKSRFLFVFTDDYQPFTHIINNLSNDLCFLSNLSVQQINIYRINFLN